MRDEPTLYGADLKLRSLVVGAQMPWLAAQLAAMSHRKPRGLKRYTSKLAKSGYFLVHHTLGLKASGSLQIATATGRARVPVDFADTALVFAQRPAGEHYEPLETAFVDCIAESLGCVFDIGANWGYYSALLATNPKFKGHVHAFEAAPGTAARLKSFMSAAQLDKQVTLHSFGLSSRDGTVHFDSGRHSALARVSDDNRGIAIEVRTLDSLGLPAPDFIKIDVEGHELEVFRGAAGTLAQAPPIVLFESRVSAGTEETLAPIVHLESLGYEIFELLWRGETSPALLRMTGAMPAKATLVLKRFPSAFRLTVQEDLNLVAWHRDRMVDLAKLFRPLD